MTNLAIVGSQWGDEGKGKITDTLSASADYVVRFQGGNNAGHTIIVGENKTVLHLIPSGILHNSCKSVIAHGVVFDPDAFLKELKVLQEAGLNITPDNLLISENCTVITSYNKLLDGLREGKGKEKIGTTGKGIGPAYEDKISRRGIKLKDLFNLEGLKKRLEINVQEKLCLFEKLYESDFLSIEEEAERLFALGSEIKRFTCDTFSILDEAVKENSHILYEGAQGVLLDIDYGTYPFVTSSSTAVGGVFTGASIAGKQLDDVIGITKAYTTRVGEGPFPTELFSEVGEFIQRKGGEIGATTGRTRRCGWLDLPLLKYAAKVSNLTSIALTKVDILAGMTELKVCTAYEYDGAIIDCAYPGIDLNKVKPVFTDLPPIENDFISGNFSDKSIGKNLQNFITTIERTIEIPVSILAYGPERDEVLFLQKFFT